MIKPTASSADFDPSSSSSSASSSSLSSSSSSSYLAQISALVLFNAVIITGNSLVILAVFTHSKLRPTATNKFIVSLAVADLLVGLTVLPFSSTNQILGYWPFGKFWCRSWLAVDVWLCTASIFNLCAISVDRYLAISRPFKYPHLMLPSRAKAIVIGVWILSFVICLPPLIGWEGGSAQGGDIDPESSATPLQHRQSPPHRYSGQVDLPPREIEKGGDDRLRIVVGGEEEINQTIISSAVAIKTHVLLCALTSEPGYIVYSSCGSFWFPMLIMLVFYWKIYKTATSATSAFRRGFIEKKGCPANGDAAGAKSMTLRVHRGSRITMRHSNGCISELLPPVTAVSIQLTRRSFDSQLAARNMSIAAAGSPRGPGGGGGGGGGGMGRASIVPDAAKSTPPPKIVVTASTSNTDERRRTMVSEGGAGGAGGAGGGAGGGGGTRRTDRKHSVLSTDLAKTGAGYGSVEASRKNSLLLLDGEDSAEKRSSLISLKLSKLNIVAQLRTLNREKKAAKTVGVIVGCFVACWTPFFTVYLLGAFCRGCTPPMLFQVFFWLGYCNSAINPFVYGLCSKEFRYAFKKLLRCRCERRRHPSLTNTTTTTTTAGPRGGGGGGGGGGGLGGLGNVRGFSRIQSVIQSFKLQIVTRDNGAGGAGAGAGAGTTDSER